MPVTAPPKKSPRQTSTEEVVLNEHLAELRGRIVLLTWVSGLAWSSLALIGGLLVIGLCDWSIHLDDSGTRCLLGLGLLSGSAWMLWRRLIAPLRVRITGSFLASRVERQYPDLENRVLSAVEFLEHRYDERLGSTELQKAVVNRAIKDLQRVDVADVVDSFAIRNVTLAALFVCGSAFLIAALNPIETLISIERLVLPFAKVPWPRAVELELVQSDLTPVSWSENQPVLIARGDTLDVYVRNRNGRLPERVWFEYRTAEEGPVVRESLRQTSLRDAAGKSQETAAIQWVATRGPLLFRATGGDDNFMPYYRVDVVPPPTIQKLQVTLTPPAYSQRPVDVLPAGVGHVQGLIGSKVQVEVTSDKPLKSVKLRIGEQASQPITVGEDGLQFSTSFVIREAFATSYWFELTDLQGFSDREAVRYELRGIADSVPEVSIDSPVTDVMLTADAELPVKILAKDDLRLKEIRIAYQVGDEEKLNSIPLFDRAGTNAINSAESVTRPELEPSGQQRIEIDYLWKMSELNLEPGARIVFRGEATDDYDLGSPHVGKSVPRRITIVSSAEKQKELTARVGDLLDDLQQATQLQQRARQETQELQTQLEKVGELRPQDVDQLARTELDQRQAASRLSNPTDGVETQARQLLEEMRSNHLTDEGTEQRLERLANELGRLAREELPDAEQSLTQARKLIEQQSGQRSDGERESKGKERKPGKNNSGRQSSNNAAGEKDSQQKPNGPAAEKNDGGEKQPGQKSQTSEDTSEPLKTGNRQELTGPSEKAPAETEKPLEAALAEAQSQQTRSLESLKDLEQSLAEWRDRRDISRDLNSVIAEQEAIQKEASEISQQTMSKSAAELTKQEKAELNKLSQRQDKVAEQLEQFGKQLQQAARSIEQSDPETAEKFNEAGKELNEKATASKLGEAANDIAENKLGEAAEAQQKAMEDLREVVRMIKQQPNENTEQFLKQTDDALQEFQQLRQEQQDLANQFQDLMKRPDSPERDRNMRDLMQKQEELAERMVKAERKLQRLRLRGPAEAAHQARKVMTEMMKHMRDADDAEETQDAMDEAIEELQEIERELVLEKRIAQERLAFEQLEKIEDELKGLKLRQQAVIDETVRLNAAKTEQDSFTRGQLKTLKELSETERLLQHTAEQMRQQMASAEIFALVLKRLSRTLMLVADRLGERDISKPTQDLENDAIRKIDTLLAVLKQEQKKQQQQNKPQEKPEQLGQEPHEQEEKPQDAKPPGDTIPQLAQLKLLKSMQEEYLERTELLEKFRNEDGHLPEAMQVEMNELAREQVELADYARNLVARMLQRQPDRNEGDEPEQPKSKPKGEPEGPDPLKIDP